MGALLYETTDVVHKHARPLSYYRARAESLRAEATGLSLRCPDELSVDSTDVCAWCDVQLRGGVTGGGGGRGGGDNDAQSTTPVTHPCDRGDGGVAPEAPAATVTLYFVNTPVLEFILCPTCGSGLDQATGGALFAVCLTYAPACDDDDDDARTRHWPRSARRRGR
jgi:hypothetical protein